MGKKLVLMTISLLLSLLVLEMTLRYFRRFKTYADITSLKGKPYLASFSSYLPFTLPKNISFPHREREFHIVYKINEFGYRGRSPKSIRKPAHKKRIIFCGDSFTLGWGSKLKSTFVQQIQDYLSSEKYSVINAAYHGGYSPDSYYAYLVKEGIELSPDIVIIVLYTGNDVTDIRDNKWLETDERGAPTKIITNRLYMNYKGNLMHPPEAIKKLLPWNYRAPVLNRSYAFLAVTQLINSIFGVSGFSDPFLKEVLTEEEMWERFSIVIKSMGEWSEENGIRLVFVLIPPDPKRENENQMHERIAHIIKNEFSRPLIDLRPHLSGEAYYARDAHFNEHGNTIASKVIFEFLKENNLSN